LPPLTEQQRADLENREHDAAVARMIIRLTAEKQRHRRRPAHQDQESESHVG
jgi:hypothetical protein